MVWGSWLTRCRGEAAPAERSAALRRPALLWIQGQDEECGWLGGGGVACWGSQGWSNVGCAAHSSPAAPLLLLFEGTDIRAMGARRPFAAPRVAGGLASADTNPRAFTGQRASYTERALPWKKRTRTATKTRRKILKSSLALTLEERSRAHIAVQLALHTKGAA